MPCSFSFLVHFYCQASLAILITLLLPLGLFPPSVHPTPPLPPTVKRKTAYIHSTTRTSRYIQSVIPTVISNLPSSIIFDFKIHRSIYSTTLKRKKNSLLVETDIGYLAAVLFIFVADSCVIRCPKYVWERDYLSENISRVPVCFASSFTGTSFFQKLFLLQELATGLNLQSLCAS